MNKEINLLYKFNNMTTKSKTGEISSDYQVLQLFTAFGPVPAKVVASVYRDFESSTKRTTKNLHFNTLESLGHFITELLKKYDSPEAFLLSTDDFNIGLDSCNDSEQFQDIFRRYGTSVENPENIIKKKSLFRNIFNK
jgi:hypothetical protein